jgi:hypothetical protein|tara:strand:- start:851 stop:1144 length:294 start_codon:yes stop_codon:yes gene_type:complete
MSHEGEELRRLKRENNRLGMTGHIKKSHSYLLGGQAMRYKFIKEYREAFPIVLMCELLEVGKSGFYAWLSREEISRVLENKRLLIEIKLIHGESRET